MTIRRALPLLAAAALALALDVPSASAQAGRVTLVSRSPFAKVAQALEQAIADHRMGLVCHANAQAGAASRGVSIKGNQVMMVFRNDFAVRLLAADPRAGFEAPIRIYLVENEDGTATVTYLPPSVLFAPYGHPEVRAVAAELDPIFKAIVEQALAAR
jgi:uncharacterized protein (DUF302 family)